MKVPDGLDAPAHAAYTRLAELVKLCTATTASKRPAFGCATWLRLRPFPGLEAHARRDSSWPVQLQQLVEAPTRPRWPRKAMRTQFAAGLRSPTSCVSLCKWPVFRFRGQRTMMDTWHRTYLTLPLSLIFQHVTHLLYPI